jgi:tetratricopeptide (TPR) repeat protein
VGGGLWLARNWLALGNPVYPFATRWFGGMSSAAVDFWTGRPPGTPVPGSPPLWQHPWLALVADDGGVGVPLSPLWLAVAVFGGRRRAFWFFAGGAAVWLMLRLDVRFLLPLVPAALIAPGPAWASRPCRAAALVALVLGAPFAAVAVARGSLGAFDPLPPALGWRARADHLRNGLDPAPEYFDSAARLASSTAPRARLLYLAGIKTYYVPRRCSTAHQDICPVPLLRELRQAGTAPRLAIRLRQQGYTVLVDLIRATTSAVEGMHLVITPAESRTLVTWLRADTAFAFRAGEADVYTLAAPRAPRRLGRVPLLEPTVLGRVTAGDPAARAAVAELEALAPESSSAMLARGLEHLLAPQPRLAEARRDLEAAVRDPEVTALAWRGLGWAQDRTGAHALALTSFRKAVALNPSDVDSRFGEGMILANAGLWDQAADALAAAARLAPGRPDIRGALDAVLARHPQAR